MRVLRRELGDALLGQMTPVTPQYPDESRNLCEVVKRVIRFGIREAGRYVQVKKVLPSTPIWNVLHVGVVRYSPAGNGRKRIRPTVRRTCTELRALPGTQMSKGPQMAGLNFGKINISESKDRERLE